MWIKSITVIVCYANYPECVEGFCKHCLQIVCRYDWYEKKRTYVFLYFRNYMGMCTFCMNDFQSFRFCKSVCMNVF